jgi:hypothetical protein
VLGGIVVDLDAAIVAILCESVASFSRSHASKLSNDAKQKLARLRASAQANAGSTAATAASASRSRPAIADAEEMDTDEEGEEQGASNVSAHSVQVYKSDDALFDAITKDADLPDENAAIEAITAQLKTLDLGSDFSEGDQLERLGELWLTQVRHAPLPESTTTREETQRRLGPGIKQKWEEALRKSTSGVKGNWKQEMATARVAGKALRETMNAFLNDLEMNIVVLGMPMNLSCVTAQECTPTTT